MYKIFDKPYGMDVQEYTFSSFRSITNTHQVCQNINYDEIRNFQATLSVVATSSQFLSLSFNYHPKTEAEIGKNIFLNIAQVGEDKLSAVYSCDNMTLSTTTTANKETLSIFLNSIIELNKTHDLLPKMHPVRESNLTKEFLMKFQRIILALADRHLERDSLLEAIIKVYKAETLNFQTVIDSSCNNPRLKK